MLAVGRSPDAVVRDRWPTSQRFLWALDRFWGRHGWFLNPNVPTTAHGACPSCRSKVLLHGRNYDREHYPLWRCFPLLVGGSGEQYDLVPLCLCSLASIAAELIVFEAERDADPRGALVAVAADELAVPAAWVEKAAS